MALINVTNVEVLDNPSTFFNPFQFQITFECISPGIQEELEWKLIYVGSAEDEKYDQELDSVLVGPVSIGKNKFVFQAPAPDASKIPKKDLLEVTVLLLTCSYKEKEFIRVGYYVNNDYEGFSSRNPASEGPENIENMAPVQLPDVLDFNKLTRNILADKPRVTRFQIPWDNNPLFQQQQQGDEVVGDDGVEEEDMDYEDVGMDDDEEEEEEEELALDMEQ